MSKETKIKPALQAAGHAGVHQSESGDLFYKPTDAGEVDFYLAVNESHPELLEIVPTFYGTLTEGDLVKENEPPATTTTTPAAETTESTPAPSSSSGAPPVPKKKKEHVIVLKSSLHGFEEPCILDIKLGHILWDDKANAEKRARLDEVARTTTSGSLDMRLTGMNVYYDDKYGPTEGAIPGDEGSGERVVFDKMYGRTLDPETFNDGLAKYFIRGLTKNASKDDGDKSPVSKISEDKREYYSFALYYFLNRLKRIRELLATKHFEMRGGSLLFVYEGLDKAVQEKLNQLQEAQDLEGKGLLSEEEADKIIKAAAEVEDVVAEVEPDVEAQVQAEDDNKEEEEDEDEDETTSQDIQDRLFKLDLIDFAHTKFFDDGRGPDPGVIRGLDILIKTFEEYVNDHKTVW